MVVHRLDRNGDYRPVWRINLVLFPVPRHGCYLLNRISVSIRASSRPL
jgi:hypothetical protein